MTEAPRGWALATLGEVASWGSGGTPTRTVDRYYGGDIPWAVIGDLNDGLVSKCSTAITEEGLRESSAKLVPPGAVLIAMYGSIGKLGIAGVEMATNQAIAFATPIPEVVDGRYFFHYLASQRGRLTSAGKGATQQNIGQAVLKAWPVPVPPLAEQERIVAIIEEHLSRLDAAEAALLSAQRRIGALERSVITQAAATVSPPDHWRVATVADAGAVSLGLQRSPKRHNGPNMRPYLRVANVFEDRIDDGDVMSMDMSDAEWERYRLRCGDVLLNEGQSPHLLGRPAIYRGDPPNVAFTNSLIRFQAGDGIEPEWALLVFRSHMHNRRFMRESQITTNIAHLAAGRFKTVEFPIPSLAEQEARVREARDSLAECERLRSAAVIGQKRAAALRRSVLAAAFSGQLVPQNPEDEPASLLLDRIRAQRAAIKPTGRSKKVVS